MDTPIHCENIQRRQDVRTAALYGLDFVEVSDEQPTILLLYFLGKAPPRIQHANLQIHGGQRVRDIRVLDAKPMPQADPTLDDVLEITVDRPGDFSTYVLQVVDVDQSGKPTGALMSGFDRQYGSVSFSFKASCPNDLDCGVAATCPPPTRVEPDINYLAKDYASFRQLMLDRLALIMPDWQETHAADLGIALVELLAYTGDTLSYYQDAVATEAYLATARQRISVRRHARLVDYRMHDGCNARAWLSLQTDTDDVTLDANQLSFITAYPGAPRDRHILTEHDLIDIAATSYEVFEPMVNDHDQHIHLRTAHNIIQFYTWGDCECCLPRGATAATLRDGWLGGTDEVSDAENPSVGRMRQLQLKIGDVLIIEEVLGPITGNAADADPNHRQAVRLTSVPPDIDPLYQQPIVTIGWAQEDALRFALCLSSKSPPPDCDCMDDVSVARGNVILVDHGQRIEEILGEVPLQAISERCPGVCEPAEVLIIPGRFRPTLQQRVLTCCAPLEAAESACAMLTQSVRAAVPAVVLDSIAPAPDGHAPLFHFDDQPDPTNLARRLAASLHSTSDLAAQALLAQLTPPTRLAIANYDPATPLPPALFTALVSELRNLLQLWHATSDLLDSDVDQQEVVVEIDNDGYGHLRFADPGMDSAAVPPAGMLFRARYRIGNGTAGNVGAETIGYIVLRGTSLSGVEIIARNPLAACGGTDPEALAEVKLFAPDAFRTTLARAITAEDYATLAMRNPKVQRAAATLRWTGSWYEVLVAIDPYCSEQAEPALLEEIAQYLDQFRRVGHDLVVKPARYVPLDLAFNICVKPHYLRAHVEAALRDVFSNRTLPNGDKGLFHPDMLTFGDGIYVSQLIAAAQAVAGVQEVDLIRLERYFEGPNDEVQNGRLQLGPLEIAQLDNLASLPENGKLVFDMRGGR
ncbi:MAG: putative baseplate assembly protein [Pseudomonadota bacterium]|nr:putative baseplate assembly protein [Pseudomonadota bacterium]